MHLLPIGQTHCGRKHPTPPTSYHHPPLDAGLARDVDHVITTVELGKILQERGINLQELPEGSFDSPLGEGTGGAVLFGTTGGVMEAALRAVYEAVRISRRHAYA